MCSSQKSPWSQAKWQACCHYGVRFTVFTLAAASENHPSVCCLSAWSRKMVNIRNHYYYFWLKVQLEELWLEDKCFRTKVLSKRKFLWFSERTPKDSSTFQREQSEGSLDHFISGPAIMRKIYNKHLNRCKVEKIWW